MDTKIKPFLFYAKKSFKFYDLKNDIIPPVIFVLMLSISFGAYIMTIPYMDGILDLYSTTNISDIIEIYSQLFNTFLISVGATFLNAIFSLFYLKAYIMDLKEEEYSTSKVFIYVLKKIPYLVLINVLVGILRIIGLTILVFPSIIVYFIFIFKDCYILDKGTKFIDIFNVCYESTKGRKMNIFRNIFVLFTLKLIISMLGPENIYIFGFVTSFFEVIIDLMILRLIALMYYDIEYETNNIEHENHNTDI